MQSCVSARQLTIQLTNDGRKADGKAKPSFTSMCLDQFSESNKPEFDEELIRDTASMFFAGRLPIQKIM